MLPFKMDKKRNLIFICCAESGRLECSRPHFPNSSPDKIKRSDQKNVCSGKRRESRIQWKSEEAKMDFWLSKKKMRKITMELETRSQPDDSSSDLSLSIFLCFLLLTAEKEVAVVASLLLLLELGCCRCCCCRHLVDAPSLANTQMLTAWRCLWCWLCND